MTSMVKSSTSMAAISVPSSARWMTLTISPPGPGCASLVALALDGDAVRRRGRSSPPRATG